MAENQDTLTSLLGVPEEGSEASDACLDDDRILAFAQGLLRDEELVAIHAHIDQCSLCQRLVVEAAHAVDADPIFDSTRPSWNTVFQNNAVVGDRYRILRMVARGGMGEVYEAFDTTLHERLALKTITSTVSDSELAVRLLKAEVQLARRISHPNVCRIYDFRTHTMESSGSAIHFLVMEFVEGECLGRKLRQSGAMPIAQAQSIAVQLLSGLRAAHQAGILHRDFKSDNVMLRAESNDRTVPVILDFGLAKTLNESGHATSTLNQNQGMVGTFGYMAPEQLEGQPLSRASDIYSFGVVWFEMLTGRLPFTGETPVVVAMERLRHAPPVPSSINPAVPAWLDGIVLRCLSRMRQNRFDSAQEVLDALAAHASKPLDRQRPNHRGLMAAVGVTVVGMALGWYWTPHPTTSRQLKAATPSTLVAERTSAVPTVAASGSNRIESASKPIPAAPTIVKRPTRSRPVASVHSSVAPAPSTTASSPSPDWLTP